jgi:hypothetical protein
MYNRFHPDLLDGNPPMIGGGLDIGQKQLFDSIHERFPVIGGGLAGQIWRIRSFVLVKFAVLVDNRVVFPDIQDFVLDKQWTTQRE